MGYWSAHPMGGDTPMDLEYSLLSRYDTSDDSYYYERPCEELKISIERDLESLIVEAEESDNFTLPFIIVAYSVTVPDKFIDRALDLLSDGGGDDRGYEQEQPGTLRNNWNNLETPQDYCDQLRFYFKDIVSGKVSPPNVLTQNVGLLDTIASALQGLAPIPVNKP